MDVSSGLGLVILVGLVLANGFFVATEFAIVAVRRSRLEQLAAAGHTDAQAALQVVSHLDTYIAACQLGITMASLALGWVGEPALAHLVEPPLEAIVGTFAPAASHGVAVAVSFAIITSLHIVLGELAPKGVALQKTEATALWVARPMHVFYLVFRGPITLLNNIGNGVLRLFGMHPASGHEMVHSVEELRVLVTGMQQAGVVEAYEARIASRAFQFGDLTAGELMTPRTEVEAVPITASLADLLEVARRGTHSRLLVYDGTVDNAVGVLHVRDLFRMIGPNPEPFRLRTLVRPVLTTPASKRADELLDEMRAARRHMAVVIDEYGGTAGLLTIENLVEGLVGQIEEEGWGREEHVVANRQDGEITGVFDGLTRLDEFEEATGLRLRTEVHENVDTLGGMVMYELGRMPMVGDEVPLDNHLLRVEELDGRRVARVRLLQAETPLSSNEAEAAA